jgi:hypothetical protein
MEHQNKCPDFNKEEMDRCPRKSIFLVLRGHPFGVQTCVQLFRCQLARPGWTKENIINLIYENNLKI